MKFLLINQRTYRDDGEQDYQGDFDCKVIGAYRESIWEKRFAMEYPSPTGWDFREGLDFIGTGRNNREIEPHFWEHEEEVFRWYIEIQTLEELIAFMNEWNCTFDGDGFTGDFDADQN